MDIYYRICIILQNWLCLEESRFQIESRLYISIYKDRGAGKISPPLLNFTRGVLVKTVRANKEYILEFICVYSFSSYDICWDKRRRKLFLLILLADTRYWMFYSKNIFYVNHVYLPYYIIQFWFRVLQGIFWTLRKVNLVLRERLRWSHLCVSS